MNQVDEKIFSFVLDHYRPGTFDTQAAWEKLSGRRRGRSLRPLWALPVAAALVLGIFLSWRNRWTEYRSYDAVQAFVLADGTRATLNPGSVLCYQPHKAPRQVSMRGKVLYEVVHDPAHPFTVSAPSATVTVLGTVFQVEADDNGTRVDVSEGRVRFSGTAGESLILTAGQGASLREGVPVREKSVFRFDATPLEEVLKELSVYYGVSLSSDAREKRLTGTFSTGSLDEILYLIQSALDVEIEKR